MMQSGSLSVKKVLNRKVPEEYLPILPGVMLCLMILIILTADIISPDMSAGQYDLFPLLFRIIHMISMSFCIIYAGSRIIGYDSIRDHITVLMIIFSALVFISTCVNGFSEDAVLGVPLRYLGAFDFIILSLLYIECSRYVRTEKAAMIFIRSYIIAADLIAAAFVYDIYIGEISAFRGKNEPSAIFFHGNHYGYFLVMAVLLSMGCLIYRERNTVGAAFSLLLNAAVLLINRSLGCIIAVAITSLALIITEIIAGRGYKKKAVALALVMIIASAASLAAGDELRSDAVLLFREVISLFRGDIQWHAGHGRWQLWTETAAYIRQKPLLGYGCEGIRQRLIDAAGTANPHNEVLTYAAFFGIPAALAYAGLVLSILIRVWRCRECTYRNITAMAAGGYFISSLFGVGMFYTLPFFFVLAGISASDEIMPSGR